MIQGTASHVGKTVFVAALCRILSRTGVRVAPFKAQNMSLNSYATVDEKEIARAQALQAFAAGIEPRAKMNPILLKPKGQSRSQIVLLGEPYTDIEADEYYREFTQHQGLDAVRNSLDSLLAEFDFVVIEGAGNPSELNLYDSDISNMKVADHSHSPVILIGDIDRGGVFASIYGTLELLRPAHRELVKGFVINKFRGSLDILEPGLRKLEEITGIPCLGVLPYVDNIDLPSEDSVSLDSSRESGDGPRIVVIKLPHISNFTDFDSLRLAGARVGLASLPNELDKADAIILPGTKNTIQDLVWLKMNGLDREISKLRQIGIPVVGICGGYQMLGKRIDDPDALEGESKASHKGLGLLEAVTTFSRYGKTTRRVVGHVCGTGPIFDSIIGRPMDGYEIHTGETKIGGENRLFIISSDDGMESYEEGAISSDGLVFGSYVHGLFDGNWITQALLNYLRKKKALSEIRVIDDAKTNLNLALDRFCEIASTHVDMARIFEIAGINREV